MAHQEGRPGIREKSVCGARPEMAGNLYIDLGNSRLKWAVDEDEGISPMQVLECSGDALHEALDVVWKGLDRPEAVWVACVGSELVRRQLRNWLAERWKLAPQMMKVSVNDCGLTCGYEDIASLGVDRWAAMIAAYRLYPNGVCVVDCGTAVTLDVVDARGQHLGGYILPGIGTMQQALLRETTIKMKAKTAEPGLEWGDSTASCIELGTRKAIIALIEQSLERMQARGICDPGLLLTGGETALVRPLIQIDHQYREALVLEGLQLYAQERDR